MILEVGATYVMDRAYLDYARLHVLHLAGSFFVTRAKSNMDAHWVYSATTDRATGIICDRTIALDGLLHPTELPRASAAHPVQGRGKRQDGSVHPVTALHETYGTMKS